MKLTQILCAGLCGLLLTACDTGAGPDPNDTAQPRASTDSVEVTGIEAPAQAPDVRTMQMWTRSCALCHVDGNAGAPRVGYAEEWLPRMAQGRDTLLKHTVEGLNSMPPLGYCMACEREDFLALIDFMTVNLAPSPTPGGNP